MMLLWLALAAAEKVEIIILTDRIEPTSALLDSVCTRTQAELSLHVVVPDRRGTNLGPASSCGDDVGDRESRSAVPLPVDDTLANAIERGKAYDKALAQRFEREAQTLARLTGQPVQPIRQRISNEVPQPTPSSWLVLHPKHEASSIPGRLGFW